VIYPLILPQTNDTNYPYTKKYEPKHLGVTRIKAAVSMKQVAERRVLERYPNMKLFGSYFLYKDSLYHWFEVILADKSHKSIIKDKEIRKRIL